MGQTLNHGVYLPAEGERNCYSGLASNWNLLDTAIGDIAGKASATHSHGNISNDGKVGTTANKPLITGTGGVVQAGSFGTAANTFCEGNDSRLSDARTPVAHTHGKADITDLFNSENTWTADNTFRGINSFSQYQIFQAGAYFYNSDSTAATSTLNLRNSKVTKGGTSDNGSQIIQFLDKDNKFLSQVTTTKALSGTTQLQFTLGNIDSNNNSITGGITFSLAIDGTKQFIPGSNNTHNLGNSSYKWKTLNGVNPGALSLPVTALNNTYDISGNITDLTGGNNSITAARTGWVFVKSDNATEISIENTTTGMGASDHSAAAATLMVSIPVTSGEILNIIANCTSIDKAYLLPCQGNV